MERSQFEGYRCIAARGRHITLTGIGMEMAATALQQGVCALALRSGE